MVYNPPIGSIYHLYTTYILPSRGLYNPYHLLPEPEKSIDNSSNGLWSVETQHMFWISIAGQYLRTHYNVTLFLEAWHAFTSKCGPAVIAAMKLVLNHLKMFEFKEDLFHQKGKQVSHPPLVNPKIAQNIWSLENCLQRPNRIEVTDMAPKPHRSKPKQTLAWNQGRQKKGDVFFNNLANITWQPSGPC